MKSLLLSVMVVCFGLVSQSQVVEGTYGKKKYTIKKIDNDKLFFKAGMLESDGEYCLGMEYFGVLLKNEKGNSYTGYVQMATGGEGAGSQKLQAGEMEQVKITFAPGKIKIESSFENKQCIGDGEHKLDKK